VRFRVLGHFNSYGRREDVDLSQTLRFGTVVESGVGYEIRGQVSAVWRGGFAFLHGEATGLDSTRTRGRRESHSYTRWRRTAPMGRAAKKPAFSKKDVGARLRRLREARDVSQVKLAMRLGVTQSNVSEMERGIRTVTSNLAVKLAKELRVSIDEILVGSNGGAEKTPLRSVKLLRRVQRIEGLPEPRQRVVLRLLDALIDQETARPGR